MATPVPTLRDDKEINWSSPPLQPGFPLQPTQWTLGSVVIGGYPINSTTDQKRPHPKKCLEAQDLLTPTHLPTDSLAASSQRLPANQVLVTTRFGQPPPSMNL